MRTVRYLKSVQIIFQVKNRITLTKALKFYYLEIDRIERLQLIEEQNPKKILKINKNSFEFTILNLKQVFFEQIDWTFKDHGRLWNYNLQYLDFLKQSDISESLKVNLLTNLYDKLWSGTLALEPYTSSLRIMNCIRFFSSVKGTTNTYLQQMVLSEVNYLSKNLEYHLLANHLLENGFALLMGGYYFRVQRWIRKAERLLSKELNEQILTDGAHFELSPMYHRIILFRVLEAIGFLAPERPFRKFLENKAAKMLTWMLNMVLGGCSLPHFNDSTDGVALSVSELIGLAKQLNISNPLDISLGSSGYRRLQSSGLDLIVDVNGISPSYQPGHAHADTFSFVMYADDKPVIVDPGISTYNIGLVRDWERSTNAHNTLELGGKSSSEVWAGFRVGRRAVVDISLDTALEVRAIHDGYLRSHGVAVERHVFAVPDGFV
ncbi:MAG TPA: alginate lyase family protein, partial [Sphingobacteriaceae bacterium]|nr:alginate lyase family protein [Sphingobacteriaceae bacterium]